MHFSTEAVPAEIRAHLNRLVSITGWKPWSHRLDWLQNQVRANPIMSVFLVQRFGLELAFEQVRRDKNRTGRYPWPPETAEQQRFYSLVAMIARCYPRLSSAGKSCLKGMVIHALKSDDGFAPLAFEVKIVAHLMKEGFDVTFHDMEIGSGFDYLIERDGVKMEIECKCFSGDIGRQIHLLRIYQLSDILRPVMVNRLEQEHGGHLIRITIPKKLEGDNKQHLEIRKLMLQEISNQESGATSNGYEVSIAKFSISDSVFARPPPGTILIDRVRNFLFDEFKIDNKNVLINFSPRTGIVLVVVESAKKDTVLSSIHRKLKHSARDQFSGNFPGVMCCELSDVTDDELRALWEDEDGHPSIENMVSKLIERRSVIHTVAFTSPGIVQIENARLGNSLRTAIQESGTAIPLKNRHHPLGFVDI